MMIFLREERCNVFLLNQVLLLSLQSRSAEALKKGLVQLKLLSGSAALPGAEALGTPDLLSYSLCCPSVRLHLLFPNLHLANGSGVLQVWLQLSVLPLTAMVCLNPARTPEDGPP